MDNTVATAETYAVFMTGGKQYQAIPGKTIEVERLLGESGDVLSFSEVLMRKTAADTFEVGAPYIEGATLKASIVKHIRGPKIVVFRHKRRKKSRVRSGHRQEKTVLRIESI